MSMMEVLAGIRERARKERKEKKQKSLPWYCLLLSDKCIAPEEECTNCHVWLKHKMEVESDDTENHNDKGR